MNPTHQHLHVHPSQGSGSSLLRLAPFSISHLSILGNFKPGLFIVLLFSPKVTAPCPGSFVGLKSRFLAWMFSSGSRFPLGMERVPPAGPHAQVPSGPITRVFLGATWIAVCVALTCSPTPVCSVIALVGSGRKRGYSSPCSLDPDSWGRKRCRLLKAGWGVGHHHTSPHEVLAPHLLPHPNRGAPSAFLRPQCRYWVIGQFPPPRTVHLPDTPSSRAGRGKECVYSAEVQGWGEDVEKAAELESVTPQITKLLELSESQA